MSSYKNSRKPRVDERTKRVETDYSLQSPGCTTGSVDSTPLPLIITSNLSKEREEKFQDLGLPGLGWRLGVMPGEGGGRGWHQCYASVTPSESDTCFSPLDFPTDGGHPVKGVYSPLEVHQCRERDVPTPRSSRPRPSSSSPSKATPSLRPHAPLASATT